MQPFYQLGDPQLPPEPRLVVDGPVDPPLELRLDPLRGLPQAEVFSDFHCVTRWSRPSSTPGRAPNASSGCASSPTMPRAIWKEKGYHMRGDPWSEARLRAEV